MEYKIGIMGCGWLGFPLAKSWKNEGLQVHGSTTHISKFDSLEKCGITPFKVVVSATAIEGDIQSFLKSIDVLILNIPPKLRGTSSVSFVAKMRVLLPYLEQASLSKVLFISSTSVYGNEQGHVNAMTPPVPSSESGKQLLKAEQLLTSSPVFQTTILRFGGLIGENRHPVTMLSAKKNLSGGKAPINLIHLDDCIEIIKGIVSESLWGKTYCAVAPFHPSKEEYYTTQAAKRNLPTPEYASKKTFQNKQVDGFHLTNDLGYVFKHPSL